jgi:hypothetical protein
MGCAEITSATKEDSAKINDTGWSARVYVILALKDDFDQIKNSLFDIAAA